MIDNSVYLTIPNIKENLIMGKMALVCLVVALITSAILGVSSYLINRDVDGWKTRAQVSSEPFDMLEYMLNVQKGMEAWDMTTGYAAIIFKTPENNMALNYHTVIQHVKQAEVLTTMEKSSNEYQNGLDNLRGSIRELELYSFAHWSRHGGLIWSILCWVGWIGFFVFVLFLID